VFPRELSLAISSPVAGAHNRYLIVEGGVRRIVSEREFLAAIPLGSRVDVERLPDDPFVTNLCYL
jgi:hypothetical protein